jgi:hypothetical protein
MAKRLLRLKKRIYAADEQHQKNMQKHVQSAERLEFLDFHNQQYLG